MKKLTNEWLLSINEIQLMELPLNTVSRMENIFKTPENNRTSLVHALSIKNAIIMSEFKISSGVNS